MSSTASTRSAPAESARFSYLLDFTDDQDQHLHSLGLRYVEFERAIRETWFAAVRAGALGAYNPQPDLAQIEPRFTQPAESARSAGFRVRLPYGQGEEFVRDFPLGYFNARASTVRAALRRQDKLGPDTKLYFKLSAYLEDQSPMPSGGNQLSFDSPSTEVPICKISRATFGATEPWDSPDETQLPILFSRTVIADGCDEAARSPDREVGGFLLGHLCHDLEHGDIFLAVTCLVPAEGTTESTSTSVTFTPESFARARELIRLRAQPDQPAEILVGWFHSHPFRFCAECPLPTPPECIQKVLFFSADDVQLMESTFAQPFMVGLLAAVEPKLTAALQHEPVRLFGWHHGEVLARGFHVVDM
jgi:proteasome lid subunit RPN8/RPN11